MAYDPFSSPFSSPLPPRFAGFANSDELFQFAKHWFKHDGRTNTIQMGFFETPGFQEPSRDDQTVLIDPAGTALNPQRSAIVFGTIPAAHTIAHEIGHLFGRLGINMLPYVDNKQIQKLDHTGAGYDLMTYLGSGLEFSVESINEIRRTSLGN